MLESAVVPPLWVRVGVSACVHRAADFSVAAGSSYSLMRTRCSHFSTHRLSFPLLAVETGGGWMGWGGGVSQWCMHTHVAVIFQSAGSKKPFIPILGVETGGGSTGCVCVWGGGGGGHSLMRIHVALISLSTPSRLSFTLWALLYFLSPQPEVSFSRWLLVVDAID